MSLALLGVTEAGTAMAAPAGPIWAEARPSATGTVAPLVSSSPLPVATPSPARADAARIESGRVQPVGPDPARIVSIFGQLPWFMTRPSAPTIPVASTHTPTAASTSAPAPRPATGAGAVPPKASEPSAASSAFPTSSASPAPTPTTTASVAPAPLQAMTTQGYAVSAASNADGARGEPGRADGATGRTPTDARPGDGRDARDRRDDRTEGWRGEVAVRVGLEQIGAPYRYGGVSPAGFDCSGFVTYVYGNVGFDLPRTLDGQLGRGRRVERDGLEPGDLVFFQNTYKAGLSHAGVYVGDGRFVHAADERTGVVVSALADGYWSSRYYGASRPDR